MDESVILSNIATILTKDLIIDKTKIQNDGKFICKSQHEYPLLEAADDEDMKFFMRLQNRKRKGKKVNPTRKKTQVFSIQLKKTNKDYRQYHYPLINLLNIYDTNDFEGHLHLSKLSFLRIFQHVKDSLNAKEFPVHIAMQTVFSISLWKLTTDEHFESMSHKFKIHLDDCKMLIQKFWHLISDNYEKYIKWPNSLAAQQQTLNGFRADTRLNIFPELFGIIGLKRLNVFLADVDDEVAIVLQIVCNADMKIIDCYVELAKHYDFDNSPIGQTLATNVETIPIGCYLLGNKEFPLKSYLMRPIDAPCYRKEHVFNEIMEQAFEHTEAVFENMAKRFNMLYALEAKDLTEVRKIVETVCALYNLCIEIEDDYVVRKQKSGKIKWASKAEEDKLRKCLKVESEKDIQRRTELIEAIVE